jgi:hypothetical protein
MLSGDSLESQFAEHLRMKTVTLARPSLRPTNAVVHVLASDFPAPTLAVLAEFIQLKVYVLPLVQRRDAAIQGNTQVEYTTTSFHWDISSVKLGPGIALERGQGR